VAVLRYKDPADNQWKFLVGTGPTGPTGPSGTGPTGPVGATGATGPTGGGLSQTSADLLYVKKAGDTMTGVLQNNGGYFFANGPLLYGLYMSDPASASPVIRGIALRDNTDLGHPSITSGITIVNDAGAVMPLTVASPNYPYQAVTKIHLETMTGTALTYADSWYSYGGGYGVTQVVKSTTGLVTIEGIFGHAGKAVTAAVAYQLGTLPVGYRPAVSTIVPGTASIPNQVVRVDLSPSGAMTFIPQTTGTLSYLSFAGACWRGVY
jgi:hypothetical protein